jgi:hypothetical protein
MGSGRKGTGTTATGKPMNEMGCVKMPMLGRNGTSAPSSIMVCWPSAGAVNGVAGARIASTPSNTFSTASRYQRRNFCALTTSAAGAMAPAISLSRVAGSKSAARVRRRSRCSAAPSVAVMT